MVRPASVVILRQTTRSVRLEQTVSFMKLYIESRTKRTSFVCVFCRCIYLIMITNNYNDTFHIRTSVCVLICMLEQYIIYFSFFIGYLIILKLHISNMKKNIFSLFFVCWRKDFIYRYLHVCIITALLNIFILLTAWEAKYFSFSSLIFMFPHSFSIPKSGQYFVHFTCNNFCTIRCMFHFGYVSIRKLRN